MAIIKYYDLESRSEDVVNTLTANLMKHMLSEKSVKGLLTASVEEIASAEEQIEEPKEGLLYDSGEFDVLYKNSWTRAKKKRRLFSRNIPARYGTELVVKATPFDIISLQGYLSQSGFDVLEARTVNKAAFSFATSPCNEQHAKLFVQTVEHILKRVENANIDSTLSSLDNVGWEQKTGGTCSGLISGEVSTILRLRGNLIAIAPSYGTSIFRQSVTFSY